MFRSNSEVLDRARLLIGAELQSSAIKDAEYYNLEQSYNEHLGKFESDFKKLCAYAGLSTSKTKKLTKNILLAVVTVLLLSLMFRSLYLSFMLPALIYLIIFYLKRNAMLRVKNFDNDYPALLISLASSIRSGLDPLVALINSEAIFSEESEIRKAISLFRQDVDRGLTEDKAVRNFAKSINHPDLELFRTAFLLARREGSSLGDCLHRLSKVTRQRQSFRRKTRAAIAMQKLSAFGIAGCTVVIGLIQYTSNPKALVEALNHPAGFKILLFGLGLILIGLFWMLRMTRSKV